MPTEQSKKRAEELEKRTWAITGEDCDFKTARVAYCRNPRCGPCMLVDQIVTLGLAVEREAREEVSKTVLPVLQECLSDYAHPNFTDRHDTASRLRQAIRALGGSHD